MSNDTRILPAHIETTIEAIAKLHAEHHAEASALEKIAAALTERAGRPSFLVGSAAIVVCWIVLNYALMALGFKPLDEPPFAWLQGAVTLVAFSMTCIILATQRRDDLLASHREQLTLELGILSEQKAAKIIELLEELRRDMPQVPNRHDAEAKALSTPADPQAVLDAIKDMHDEPADAFSAVEGA